MARNQIVRKLTGPQVQALLKFVEDIAAAEDLIDNPDSKFGVSSVVFAYQTNHDANELLKDINENRI